MTKTFYQCEYQEAQAWIRHYSVVRMTVTPALVGLGMTLLGFLLKAEKPLDGRVVVVCLLLWGFAAVLLGLFSVMEARELRYAKKLRNALLQKEGAEASVSRGNLCLGDAFNYQDLPLAIGYAAISILIVFTLCFWKPG